MEKENFLSFARRINVQYKKFRTNAFASRRFSPKVLQNVFDEIARSNKELLTVREVGTSFEGRTIRLVSVGTGKTNVLLWSQMHGDESTATMAIADILNYFIKTKNDDTTRKILSSLHLLFLPMLNPDGASRFRRRTAQNIDMNRDALALVTPEAKILKQVQNDMRPQIGFNLHDQELCTVATTKELTAIALLAPAFNQKKSDNAVRTRAKYAAATIATAMKHIQQHRLARYDDTFEPRAFGDNMQQWGTSTVLIESGHSLNDPEKNSIRRFNVVGILSCLYAIATGEYRRSDIKQYEQLPLNGKKAYDIIIRNVRVRLRNKKIMKADIAISYQVDTHSESKPRLVDLGDLHTFVGLKEINGGKKLISHKLLQLGRTFDWEKFFHN